jgi:choline dehydrogenase-like flavoprotein
MTQDFDAVIIGSGAGAGPVALTLAQKGCSVLVLEKGPWFTEADFYKDELACCRRSVYTPELKHEFHVLEEKTEHDGWQAQSTEQSGRDFWNGNMVGGSSNLMSGYFYRLKPQDFRLLSEFGPIAGANMVDWPISYADLEPYYTKVEQEVGVSGRVVSHAFAEPRSSADFPYPPTGEHPMSKWLDESCQALGFTSLPTPRAILSQPTAQRRSCEYSGYCGSYGCASGAKGSSRAALLERAIASGNCQIRPNSKVFKLSSDAKGKIKSVHFYDSKGLPRQVTAKVYVVACQAIESSRLLLASAGPKHPNGLANNRNQVGKNIVFSAGGVGHGDFHYRDLDEVRARQLKMQGPFVNRGLQDWYTIDDKQFGAPTKGGTIDFLFAHPNAIAKANRQKWDDDDHLIWGSAFKQRLMAAFTDYRTLNFEMFCDWLPTDNCFVSLDPQQRDRWGNAVAKIRIDAHPHDLKIARYLAAKGQQVLQHMGAKNLRSSVSSDPPQNLQAGGCRFGDNPQHSVLDADCRAHDVENLFVTDGSFMPTGGSVPFTWTIYANAFRVADKIASQLGRVNS